MEIHFWILLAFAGTLLFLLSIKIISLKRAAREIEKGLSDRLAEETNTLICISSGDRDMRALANSLNRQLRLLRKERRRYQQGDAELKNAVTNISHDLRTPLTAVYGYLDLLQKETLPETSERYVRIIRERTERMKELTEELFRYSLAVTAAEMTIEPIILNHVLEESAAAFYTAMKEKGIDPDIRLPEKKIIRQLDRPSVSRIFSNLLSNAVRHSAGDLEITLTDDGTVTFANTAPNLDAIQVGQLFDRFYTVQSANNSTGLGLAIVRTLTEQMGGTAEAEYENGRLRIRLCFPENRNE